MLKRRFVPYIIGVCLVTFLFLSYIGYKAYQRHVEFERWISDAQSLNRAVNGQNALASKAHTHSNADDKHYSHPHLNSPGTDKSSPHSHFPTMDGNEEYVYEVNGVPLYSDRPLSQEDLVIHEWLKTGKMSPPVQEAFQKIKSSSEFVKQRVVTPDGKLHQVVVPRNQQYEEGDAILPGEINSLALSPSVPAKGPKIFSVTIDGVNYYPPEEYYSIEAPYERAEYEQKFEWSKANSISMADIEKKVAQGELDFSLSDQEKRIVDQAEERDKGIVERIQTSAHLYGPQLSDKAQQLIDRYGTEEGLRRLRESAPEAARRFEQERLEQERRGGRFP